MNRDEYSVLRAALRLTEHRLSNNIRHDEMADSRLMVQIDSQAERVLRLRERINAIRQQMPACLDVHGFRTMYSIWMRRRIKVLADARAEASRAGDGDKFIRMHKLYNKHVKRGRA